MRTVYVVCPRCGGTGFRYSDVCDECGGSRQVKQEPGEVMDVKGPGYLSDHPVTTALSWASHYRKWSDTGFRSFLEARQEMVKT